MKKQINECWNSLLQTAFLVTLIFSPALVALAQESPKFKVGDRVKASPLSMSDEKYWRSCTVVEVVRNGYSIKCDAKDKGGAPDNYVVNAKWVKPPDAQAETIKKEENESPAKNENTKPETKSEEADESAACFESDEDSKGKTALEKSFRGVIRQMFEKEPAPGYDGKVTVSFEQFEVGQPRKFRLYVDGPDADTSKPVYQVRTIFTTCTDYRKRIVKLKRERAFSCYTNTFGKYQCGQVALGNKMEDETRSIPKPE